MRFLVSCLLGSVVLAGCGGSNSGPLTVSKLFTNGAVLQQNTPVPVWGTAPAGTRVSVALDDAVQTARAQSDGTWQVNLEPRQAGGPHRLVTATATDTLVAEDLWFGDVWIASGQSNMEWPVSVSNDAENEISSANDPLLRHYKVPRTWAYEPEDTLAGGEWQPASPDHVGSFSAVGYFFARELRATQDVPIGILNTSWGGSRIEAWMTPEALQTTHEDIQFMMAAMRYRADSLSQHFRDTYGASDTEDPGLKDSVAVWADPALDTADWIEIPVPEIWEDAGVTDLDGIAWYRKTVMLSEEAASTDAMLHLGTIDDRDMTWINGHFVGETRGVRQLRAYSVPADLLQPGENTIAVRVHDTGGLGGMATDQGGLELVAGDETVPLSGMWQFQVGQFVVNPVRSPNQQPTLLYNKMIHPILSYPITGFIWYQGESNGNSPEDAERYAVQFQSMINLWRELWQNERAPFLFVSLANFRAALDEPAESNWGILRESQSAALELENVGQAITLDIGEANDIHPRNKQDVGKRLALAARRLAYGEDLVYSGPTFRDHVIEHGRVAITFDHVGSGLVAHGDALGGFAIAGADSAFVWADARIEDNVVIVSHPTVAEPISVRYAWADNPDRANLFNVEGLPAAPFRTGH